MIIPYLFTKQLLSAYNINIRKSKKVKQMVSIRDIARLAGVSPATVSRILNYDKSFNINKETRARVIEIANRTHYSKDKTPRGPKSSGKGMTIGLILRHDAKTEPRDPYFVNIHQGIIDEAERWRLRLELLFTMHQKEKNWNEISKFGAIIIVGQMSNEAIKKIKKLNKNLIIIDAPPLVEDCNYINNDFAQKIEQIMEYLYKLGHRNIVYIGGKSSYVDMNGKTITSTSDNRSKAYLDWMKIHNLTQYSHAFLSQWGTEEGLKSGQKMLNLTPLPTAVVVGSDPMAIGVYKALSNNNIEIPKQISVVSFDDVDINKYLTPTLSSVYMDSTEMGRIAVRLAKSMIIEKNTFAIHVICQSKLNIRESISKNKN